jgi:hypothetical protein
MGQPGESLTYSCTKCVDGDGYPREFGTKVEFSEHMEKHKLNQITVTPAAQVAQQPGKPPAEPKPVQLQYVYKGDCPNCKIMPVETIELDVASKHVVIAWCARCKKQYDQREVEKL